MDKDVTEPVDALRAVNETESRLPLRILLVADAMIDWRGTLEVDVEGEARMEECLVARPGFVETSS